ncbi:hypothetical protein GQ457_09G010450 [Hibiscus cannabinus]
MKSGYRLLMDDQCGNSEISDASLSRFYVALWSANVPSRLRSLCGRLLMFPGKTVAHLLRGCDFANQLVNSLGLPIIIKQLKVIDGDLLVDLVFAEQDVVGIPTRHVGQPGLLHWKSHPLSVIKFNFDATFNQQSRLSTTSVLGRNSQGLIMAACASPHSNVADAFVAEAITCKQAVQFAKEFGFSNLVIEVDSLTLFKKINSCVPDRSVIAPIMFYIKEISLGFHSIIFSFVRQDSNNTAHVLARECRSIQNPCYWIEEAPVGTTAASEVDRGVNYIFHRSTILSPILVTQL